MKSNVSPKSEVFRLGELLIRRGLITVDQIDEALETQRSGGGLLGDILVRAGLVSGEEIARTLAAQLDIPYVDLTEELHLDRKLVRLIPEPIARRHCLLAVESDFNRSVTVVMKDPLDLPGVDIVRTITQMDVRRAVGVQSRIEDAINRFYSEEAHIESNLQDILDLETGKSIETATESPVSADQLRIQANDAPVVRFVNLLLMQAVRDRASDIHFEPGENEVTVRLRVDGELRPITPPPFHLYQAIVSRIKILSNMDIAERRLPLDGRFKFRLHDRQIDVRVSSLPEVHGEKMALRILDRASLVLDMEHLGFRPELRRRFERVLTSPHGIILLTGPTGSGKTTTLYSALSYLRSPTKNIQTVEDPAEYQLPGINQMSIRSKIGLDFASALRSILRQDPDIIMIGEIRDLETARIATRAALTGHLVLSTLHTNDAPSAFSRLRDIGVEPYLIAATVKLVISQRLVRGSCPRCRRDCPPTPELLKLAAAANPDVLGWNHQAGAGCEHCGKTGYRGRFAIIEYLETNESIRELVLAGRGDGAVRAQAVADGMETLLLNGLSKVRDGLTTLDEILGACPLTEFT